MARNFCTIYCDASVRKEGSFGGYWIRSEWLRHSGGKMLDSKDINFCELQIAYYAIKEAIELHKKINISLMAILVASDNMYVVDRLKHGAQDPKKIRSDFWHQVLLTKELLSEEKVRYLYTKHVKAHQGTSNTQQWLNNQVDRIAKGKEADRRYSTKVFQSPQNNLTSDFD
jgi:ribonuclease HI